MMHYFISFFGLFALDLIRIIIGDSTRPLYNINTCDETGRKAIFCEEGEVIKIVDVRLMPHNYSSLKRDVVADLCNGLNSCSLVDLRKQLFYYCQNYPDQQVYTSFECIPASVKPFCRTNICSTDNPTIKCRRGNVFHLLGTKCFSMTQDCPAEVYTRIFRSCEGQRQCQLSVLRAGIPQSICNDSLFRQQNLFMDYICVDKSVITSTCTGTFIDQKPRFGILRNHGYPNNPVGNKNGCYWVIYRDKDTPEEIEVIVHEAYSVEGQHVCDSEFLQVQYTLCETHQQTIDRFCDKGRVNVRIRSCGTVYVTHYKFLKGEDRGNRFLLSYSVKLPSATSEPYEQYASQCEKRNPAIIPFRYTLPQPQTTTPTPYVKPTKGRSMLPEDQPINDSSVGDPEAEPTEEVKDTDDDKESFDPWRMVTLLRVVVVNIFLGLLIVALIMALTFVCYRYITIGREKKRETAKKSETATTLDDKQGTGMQLLPQDGDAVPSSSNRQTNKSQESLSSDVRQDPATYETTIFHFNRPNVDTDDETTFCDPGTGVSSFLPHPPLRRSNGKQQNAESAYSSLDDEQEDIANYSQNHDHLQTETQTFPNRNISNTKSAQLTKQISIDDERRQTVDMPLPNLSHLLNINEDNYAVVKKVPGQRNHKQPPDQTDIHQTVIENSKESQYARHIHAVPEDIHSRDHSTTPTTMQLIPEHDCLLHKIPPPPPPPARLPGWDSPARSSYSSVQADV